MYDRTDHPVRIDHRTPMLTELQAAVAEEIEDAQRRIYENAQRLEATGRDARARPKIT